MAIRKKTTAESETAKTGQSSSRLRNPAAEATTATDNKTAKTKSPAAATHKSSARPVVKAAPVAEVLAESIVVEKTTFDTGLHHEEISKEAYINWLRNGCPQGSEHHDWITAIEIVRARHQK